MDKSVRLHCSEAPVKRSQQCQGKEEPITDDEKYFCKASWYGHSKENGGTAYTDLRKL